MGVPDSNDARCSSSISKYKYAYSAGVKAFEGGLPSSAIPYAQGTKVNSDKRVAWYSGWMDARTKQWERDREERRNNSSSS